MLFLKIYEFTHQNEILYSEVLWFDIGFYCFIKSRRNYIYLDIFCYFFSQDTFFYSLVYDPSVKTLLADKGEIRVGPRYQADIPEMLLEGMFFSVFQVLWKQPWNSRYFFPMEETTLKGSFKNYKVFQF